MIKQIIENNGNDKTFLKHVNCSVEKLKLRFEEQHLLDKLLEDDDFVKYAKTKLDNRQCRLLGLGEKRVRKEKKKKENITTLDRWL